MSAPSAETTNATNTPIIKTEVKIEAEDTPKLHLPSSTRPLMNPLPQQQSTLKTPQFDRLLPSLPFPIKPESQLNRFPLMMNDPFTMTALLHFKNLIDTLFKETLRHNPLILEALAPKKLDKKPTPTPTAPVEAKDPFISVKKEDTAEKTTTSSKSTEAEKVDPAQKKPVKKKAQNRIKNIPGLIMQRVRSSIKAYFTRNPRMEKQEKRLAYVEKVLGSLSKQDKDKLLEFLESYQKNWKTWNTIQKYLQTNPRCGEILLDVVLEFFQESGLEDFNDWLTSGKMGEKSKAAVTEMKDRIGQKFSKILLKPVGEEEEIAEPAKEKMVKQEEN